MQTLEELDQAIKEIEDFNNTSQLPWPNHVKEMMFREELPKLVKQLREAYETIKTPQDVNAIPRKPAFSIRGTISTT